MLAQRRRSRQWPAAGVPGGAARQGQFGLLPARHLWGAVAELEAKSSGKGPIGYIFAGRSRYLEWAWPRFGKKTRASVTAPVTGWDADNARQALVTDACAIAVGFFAHRGPGRARPRRPPAGR